MRSIANPFLAALALALLPSTLAWPTNANRRSQCHDFAPSAIEDVAVVGVTYYDYGDLVNLTSSGGAVDATDLDPFCRVQLWITTNATTGNGAVSELWLPDDWNSRLLGVGNGGWSGGVVYSSLSYDGANRGFATFSTNTGHNSSTLDGTWGYDDPNAIIDFGWRAMHMTVVAAKNLTEQYYGDAAKKNYYLGCSTAGRQGIKEMSRFPSDFDGVVIGSPANEMAGLQAWSLRQDLAVLPVNSSQWIPASTWELIHAEALKQCDGIDGVLDGVISDPRDCHFRPEALTCRPGQNASTCLNVDQINALRTVYTDYYEGDEYYEVGGELLYANGLVGTSPFSISTNYYQDFILNDTTWDFTTLNYSTIQKGYEINPGNMDTTSRDLLPFFDRGGKLLHYVGWSDQLIAPGNSLRFYEDVAAYTLANSEYDVDDKYRLFTVPGMGHCNGGSGANGFGGEVLMAMVDWIEQDSTPEYLVATKYVNDNATLGTAFTRKLCPYPLRGTYAGGDNTTYTSFDCK
ncbi:feruloyl esterase-like protein [Pseudohyphozyma bogoriensis]|nr:feruloyl esterase-like protein [Pseudohyphozyma bogoriensis]